MDQELQNQQKQGDLHLQQDFQVAADQDVSQDQTPQQPSLLDQIPQADINFPGEIYGLNQLQMEDPGLQNYDQAAQVEAQDQGQFNLQGEHPMQISESNQPANPPFSQPSAHHQVNHNHEPHAAQYDSKIEAQASISNDFAQQDEGGKSQGTAAEQSHKEVAHPVQEIQVKSAGLLVEEPEQDYLEPMQIKQQISSAASHEQPQQRPQQREEEKTSSQIPEAALLQQQNVNQDVHQAALQHQQLNFHTTTNLQQDERVVSTPSPFNRVPLGVSSQVNQQSYRPQGQLFQGPSNIVQGGSFKPQIQPSVPSQSQQPYIQAQQNQQMQAYVRKFLDLVKDGNIDQVLQEHRVHNYDVGSLLDEANYKQTPMFSTSLIRNDGEAVRMARVLRELGVKPDQPDTLNQTALYYGSREGKLQLIDFLVKEGNCKVNHVDTYGQSPMFYAAREGHIEAIKKLVSYGGDIDLVDNNGQTPIFYAIKGGRADIVEYMLQNGINRDIIDKKNTTLYQWTKRHSKAAILELLKHYNAAPESELAKQKGKAQQPPQIAAAQQQPKPTKINEKKLPRKFQLTILKDGQYEPISDEEWARFCEEQPELAKYFQVEENSEAPVSIDTLEIPEAPENAPIYECWDKAAKRMLTNLWKHSSAWIFHDPVDPKKLNIPDYLDIIKQPMDFGTIKEKLNSNQYLKFQDFLYDVNLVFENCIQYNGENSQVSVMCRSVREEFNRLYQQLFMDYYI